MRGVRKKSVESFVLLDGWFKGLFRIGIWTYYLLARCGEVSRDELGKGKASPLSY
jgi:hypothetical protein